MATKNARRTAKKATTKPANDPAGILIVGAGANDGNGDGPKRLAEPFDLGRRRAQKTSEVVVLDPMTGEDSGIRIGIMSVYSNEAREAARAAAERQAIAVKSGAVADEDDEDDDGLSPEVQSNIVEQTIGVTRYWFLADLSQPRRADGTWARRAGFEDVIVIDGERIPCNPDTVRALYTDSEFTWIQRRVQDWYLAIRNFFVESKTAS